jgi:hypothetical protein
MSIESYLERNDAQRRMTTTEECLEFLQKFTGEDGEQYHIGGGRGPICLFRGHDEASYPLLTSLDRHANSRKRQSEDFLLREFRRGMHQHWKTDELPKTDLETLALMQHFGVPTRLLDITRNPYIALYFAVRDVSKEEDAAVWAFYIHNIEWTSTKRVKSKEPELMKQINRFRDPYSEFLDQELFAKWFMSNESSILGENLSPMKHQEIILRFDPFKTNPRIAAQEGLFLASGSPTRTFEETLLDIVNEIEFDKGNPDARDPSLIKIIIPGDLRHPLMRKLEEKGITAAHLLGGAVGFGESLKEKLTFMDDHDLIESPK